MIKSVFLLLSALSLCACGAGTVSTAETADSLPESTETAPTEQTVSSDSLLKISFESHELLADFAENSSAEELRALLAQGPLTIQMEDYGGFEKVGPLGTDLTRTDEDLTTEPGDVILYQGNQIVIYYGTNSWNFTQLAKIQDTTDLKEKLGDGSVSITLSLQEEE